MRIHSLRLRGIGPFQHEQRIDVDEVGRQGLFLLDGPTGAGKSTIVDAIVYALFGQTATEDGQDRMVSDFLGEDVPKDDRPFVELVFSTNAGAFRVRREPKSPYINRNGNAAHHNPTARLWRLPSEAAATAGDLLASGNQEVGHEILALLGLNRDQVLSTMVLAQGQFATFLRAKSEDRRAILQSVFNTGPYERLQSALLEERKEAFQLRGEAKGRFGTAVAVFLREAEIAGDAEEYAGAYRRDPQAQQALVDARIEELRLAASTLEEQLARLEESSNRAAREFADAQDTSRRAAEKRALLARLQTLNAQVAETDALRAEIERAGDAELLAVVHRNLRSRESELEERASRAKSLALRLPESEHELGPEDLHEEINSVVAQRAGFREALDAELGLPTLAKRLAELDLAVGKLTESIAKDKAVLDGLPARIEALEGESEKVSAVASGLESARQELKGTQEGADILAAVEELAAKANSDESRADEARRAAVAADARLSSARARYREGIAAELADGLADGDPCPVCGSAEHPRVAGRGTDHVSADDLERLDADWRALDGTWHRAKSDLAGTMSALAGKREALGDRDRDSIDLAKRRAGQKVRESKAAQERQVEISTELRQLRNQRQTLADTLADANAKLAGSSRDREHLDDQIRQDMGRISAGRGDFDTVSARLDHLKARQDLLELVRAARQDEATARASFALAHDEFDAALVSSPFPDEAQFLAAVRDHDWITTSEQRVHQHGKDMQEVQAGLASDRLKDVDESQQFDLAALSQAADSAKESAQACSRRAATATKARDDAADAAGQLRTAWDGYRRIDQATRPIIRLANLVNGDQDNLHRIKLATYVVMRRFGDVVDAANSHLTEMSDGRYRLEVAGAVGGERKMGLGLNVYDDRTDAPRSPTTLSGGETFYVSLSLALGLADVVQSEAGGVSLETLFVDEGFGSLDAETLDTVMNVLTRLGRGHRTVGLISHVEEMKRRVTDRVEIHRPDPHGPSQIKERV